MLLPGLILLLLIFSGVFSALETAFISLTRGQLETFSRRRGASGKIVRKLFNHPDRLLITLLIGNNLANIGSGALVSLWMIRLGLNHYIGAASGILTFLVLIFSEVAPKRIAMVENERICLFSAYFVYLLNFLFYPLSLLIQKISFWLIRPFIGTRTTRSLSFEALLSFVKAGSSEGLLRKYEEEIVRNALHLRKTPVSAILTHRKKVFSLEEETPLREALTAITESGYSRIPLTQKEKITGIVLFKDLVRTAGVSPSENPPLKNWAHPPHYIPEHKPAYDILSYFKNNKLKMAVVLNEYGEFQGIVTLSDIVQWFLGALYDEHEEAETEKIQALPGGENWLLHGESLLEQVRETCQIDFGKADTGILTLNGYLLDRIGHIPEPGRRIELPEGRYEILEMNGQQIVKIRFTPAETS